nr:hypothetical protein [Tanacetum cinerariifolium]
YGAILPKELTNEAIRNSKSYKEYYAIASRAKPSKIKASVKKKQVGSDTTMPPLTAKGKRLKTSAKAAEPAKKKQLAKTSKAKESLISNSKNYPLKRQSLHLSKNLVTKEIKVITDFNVNRLHQPWRSFAAVINKCLGGKSTGYDSLRLSQAQILSGMYHKKNVDFAYLLWEDFVYQVEQKDAKRRNEMYYPRFTMVIVNFFITKDQSILRKNKVN